MTGKQSGNGGRSLGFSPLEEVGGGGGTQPRKGYKGCWCCSEILGSHKQALPKLDQDNRMSRPTFLRRIVKIFYWIFL